MTLSSLKGWKTLWEKEKLLFMSNFSFTHSVFQRLLLQTHISTCNQGLFGKGVENILVFDDAFNNVFECI